MIGRETGLKWVLGSFLLFNAGCAALLIGGGAAAGVGTVAYVKGELKSTQEVPLDAVWKGTLAAIEELEFVTTKHEKDALSATLTARGAEDKKITIKLKRISETLTQLRIRVGTFGDENLSHLILDKIKARAA